jgi:hypothetical protein
MLIVSAIYFSSGVIKAAVHARSLDRNDEKDIKISACAREKEISVAAVNQVMCASGADWAKALFCCKSHAAVFFLAVLFASTAANTTNFHQLPPSWDGTMNRSNSTPNSRAR